MFATANVEKVIRHLVRFGSSPSDAEDMAQETLVIAWRKKDELDPQRSLDAWLFGIARNVYRNHARTVRRRPVAEGAQDLDLAPSPPTMPLSDIISLRDALQTLPENQQDVVIVHELEEHTLKETAELLAIPFDTAKDRLRRARTTLRDLMRDELSVGVADERRDTGLVAKAAVASVLAGFIGLVASTEAAAAGAVVASQAGSHAGAAVAKTSAWISKLGFVVAMTSGVVVGVVADRVVSRRHETVVMTPSPEHAIEPPVRSASLAPTASGSSTAALDAGTIEAAAVAQRAPVAGSDRSSVASGPGVDPEAQLIERARTALTRGRFDEALRTLMSHERQFSAGQLSEERDVLLVEAYLAAGNLRLARQRVDHYQATYPTGLHRTKVSDAAREIDRRIASDSGSGL